MLDRGLRVATMGALLSLRNDGTLSKSRRKPSKLSDLPKGSGSRFPEDLEEQGIDYLSTGRGPW